MNISSVGKLNYW